jgi:hypothetical protein
LIAIATPVFDPKPFTLYKLYIAGLKSKQLSWQCQVSLNKSQACPAAGQGQKNERQKDGV